MRLSRQFEVPMNVQLTPDEQQLVKAALIHYGNSALDAADYMSQKSARDANGNPPKKADIDKAYRSHEAALALYDRLFVG